MSRIVFIVFCFFCIVLSSCVRIAKDEEEIGYYMQKHMYKEVFRLSDFGASPFSGGSQGMDVFDDRIMFQAGLPENTIYVLDLDEVSELGSVIFHAPEEDLSHMNNINCGDLYSKSDKYPLLYLSQTIGSHSCYVIRLKNDVSSYELIQTIKYIGSQHHVNSEYDWFIDTDHRFIYTYGKHNGSLEDREIVKFPLPPLEQKSVVFSDNDVLGSFILNAMSIYQGSKIINGLLYAPVGYGTDSYPGSIKIISLESMNVIHDIKLNCGEPESIGQYKSGALLSVWGNNPHYYFIKL